jgi:hypothetical protein
MIAVSSSRVQRKQSKKSYRYQSFFSIRQSIKTAVIGVSEHLITGPKQKLVLQYTEKSTIVIPAANLENIFEAAYSYVHHIDPSVQAHTLSRISSASGDISSKSEDFVYEGKESKVSYTGAKPPN